MLNKMASLIMSVHDSVMNYIKKAKDKDIAGKIGSEVLDMVKDIVKKHMFDPPNVLTYWSIKPIKILSREMIRVNKLVVRRMKPSPVGKTPWKISLSRYMPTEIFDLFDNYIQLLMVASSRKTTSFTRTIEVADQQKVVLLFLNLANINEAVLTEDILLQSKSLRDGMKCCLIVNAERPFVVHYSNKRELIKFTLSYGCWNRHGIPQRI